MRRPPPQARSPHARRWRCSGAGCAGTRSRSSRWPSSSCSSSSRSSPGQIVKLFGAHPPNAQNSDALDDVRLGRRAGPRLHHGDRRARARRLQPHALRRARLARDGLHRDRPDRRHRRDAGHDRGLLPRLRRHRAVALDGRRARLPGAAAGPRPRRGVLAEGLPDRRLGRPRPLHRRGRHPAHPGHRGGHIAAARASRLPRHQRQRLGAAPGAGRRLPLRRHRLLVRGVVERDADPAGPARS